jgi:hypothetical protein
MLGTLGRHGCHRPMSILRRCIAAETRIRGCGTLALGSAIGSERQDAFQESKASQNSMDCAVLPCISRQKHPVSTVCNCMKNEGPLDGRRAGPNPILKYYRSGSFHGAGWRKEVSSGDHERR